MLTEEVDNSNNCDSQLLLTAVCRIPTDAAGLPASAETMPLDDLLDNPRGGLSPEGITLACTN